MPSPSQIANNKPAAPAAPVASEAKPQRFVHPDAFQTFVLTPFDSAEHRIVAKDLEDEFSFLETPPKLVREIEAGQLFPGVVFYIAHQAKTREKNPDTGRFENRSKMHVSAPIKLQDFYALSRSNGGLDTEALLRKVNSSLLNDPKGVFWVARSTADGGLKIHNQ